MLHRRHLACLITGLVLLAPAARAEAPRFFDLEGFSRLLEGTPDGTALGEDGAIGLALPVKDRLADPSLTLGASCLWRDEVVAARVGEPAQVVAIDAAGRSRVVLADLGSAVVTRMAVHQDRLVLAMAPKPHLVFVDAAGATETVMVPDVGFVWDMASAPDGSLVVATGEPGRIMVRRRNGAWNTLFAADEAHIKTLAWDDRLGLFAGGGERGIVYHGQLTGEMRALYDSGATEVTSLAIDGNYVFAAAVSGAAALVAEQEAERGGAAARASGKAPTPEVRSMLVRIGLDGTSDVLAGSTDEVVFDVVRERPGTVLIATGAVGRRDARGRLYRLDATRKVISLMHQSPARRLVRLLVHPSGQLLAVGQEGTRISAFGPGTQGTGSYTSPALDLGMSAQAGIVQALGDFPPGSHGTLSVRTGQTAEPDNSWSAWSTPVDVPQGEARVPRGRFAQVRLVLRGRPQAQPQVLRLRLAYLRQNVAPFVRDVGVLERGIAWGGLPQGLGQDDSRARIVPVVGENAQEAGNAEGRRPPARARQTQERGALTVRWLADDANNDELSYTLWVRRIEDRAWRLLADNLSDPFFTMQGAQLADGHYVFRVRASDIRSNPTDQARSDERESRAILVDNTPPTISRLKVGVKNGRAQLTGEVAEAAGLLTRLAYAVDGEPLRPLAPVDGVLDGPSERIDADVGPVLPGAHTLTLVAVDEAQNEAYAQVSFTAPLAR